MKNNQLSPTYVKLLDLLFRTKLVSRKQYATQFQGSQFTRVETGLDTIQSREDFFMNASELWKKCTPHEWHLIGRIGSELKLNCSLWCCDSSIKSSSSTKKAIKSLINLKVLVKTETTDIYLVNPVYIRRGDVATVLYTTASILQNVSKVTSELVRNYKSVEEYTPVLTENQVDLFLNN